jgi:hypothetical protein
LRCNIATVHRKINLYGLKAVKVDERLARLGGMR